MHEKIKNIINKELLNFSIEKIILFGSRARGDNNFQSDYDIYIILNDNLDWDSKARLTDLILEKLADADICADVILSNKDNYEYYKKFSDTVTHYVFEEGVEI